MNSLTRSLTGIGLTAGAVYFFDPTSGHRRRLLLRDRCARAARKIELGTRDARHKASERTLALTSSARPALGRDRRSDRSVFKDARGALRDCVSHPESIALAVDDGHVILRGDVLPHEHQLLLDEVRSMPGVRIVTDHLMEQHIGNSGFSVDAGHRFKSAAAPGGWSIAGRIAAGGVGCALLAWGVHERKALGEFGASVGDRLSRFYREQVNSGVGSLREAGAEAKEPLVEAADNVRQTAREAMERESARSPTESVQPRQHRSDGGRIHVGGSS